MRAARPLVLSVALVLAAVSGCHAGRAPAPAATRTAPRAAVRSPDLPDPQVQRFVRLVNQRRSALGCPPLVWDDRLAAVARRHSEDMARRRFFAHTNPDGESPFDRLRESGIDYRAAAENLAEGDLDGRSAYDGWMRSPGHRRNLENCTYTRHGVGRYASYWTHVFIRPTQRRPR